MVAVVNVSNNITKGSEAATASERSSETKRAISELAKENVDSAVARAGSSSTCFSIGGAPAAQTCFSKAGVASTSGRTPQLTCFGKGS